MFSGLFFAPPPVPQPHPTGCHLSNGRVVSSVLLLQRFSPADSPQEENGRHGFLLSAESLAVLTFSEFVTTAQVGVTGTSMELLSSSLLWKQSEILTSFDGSPRSSKNPTLRF